MDKLFLVNLTDKLIPVFKFAAEISLKYREKGLIKIIKEDNIYAHRTLVVLPPEAAFSKIIYIPEKIKVFTKYLY